MSVYGSLVARVLRAVLTHPAAMAMKRPLRDLSWRRKGRGLRNPPMPAAVGSCLFVCLGNICRSPFGALLAARLLEEAGRGDIRCASAGITPSQAKRSPDDACAAARAYGIPLEDHVPQPLTAEAMASYDLVVVMEAEQLRRLRSDYPAQASRVVLLSLFDEQARGAFERYNIADPFGHPPSAFVSCYARMARAIELLVGALISMRPDPVSGGESEADWRR